MCVKRLLVVGWPFLCLSHICKLSRKYFTFTLMSLNFTHLLIALIFAAVLVYGINALKPVEQPKEVVIDSTAIKALEAFKREFSGKVEGLKIDLKTLKTQRQNVHKEVELFTDSDVIRFNDSISAIYCLANRP